MMIWKKSEVDETPARTQPQPSNLPSSLPRGQAQTSKERALIGASIEIKGNLAGSEDLVIEGRIEGKIELRQHGITVGRNGYVKGDLYGLMIVVMGEIDGNLYGEEQIILRQTCTVRGNISAPRVTLEDGAHFKGSIDMTPPSSVDAGPTPA
jgi:cytoskeletal protein CcmA (bactofilin family)